MSKNKDRTMIRKGKQKDSPFSCEDPADIVVFEEVTPVVCTDEPRTTTKRGRW